MKALSVRAPWWWFILYGGKDIENRDWATKFRGTIYLHVSRWWRVEDVYQAWMFGLGLNPEILLPTGGVTLRQLKAFGGCLVGKVDIVDCVARSESPWFFGDYGFVLRNAVAFERAIPWKGALGFFDVPEGIEL